MKYLGKLEKPISSFVYEKSLKKSLEQHSKSIVVSQKKHSNFLDKLNSKPEYSQIYKEITLKIWDGEKILSELKIQNGKKD